MAYHLARVAHWIGNGSVAYYPTSNDRQNLMGPGAEYLILFLQVVSRSDLWANSVQLFSYATILASLPALARQGGIPRSLSPWAAVFFGSMPIVVLEATSTQNDVVAAMTLVALIFAAHPFLHRRPDQRQGEALLLGATVAAAYLVKPTALIVGTPFLSVVAWNGLRSLRRKPEAPIWLKNAALVALAALVVAGPDLARKLHATHSIVGARYEVYPFLGEWGDRAFNGVRALCQVGPSERGIVFLQELLRLPKAELWCGNVFVSSEDVVGSPLQLLVTYVVLAGALLWCWRLRKRQWAMLIACLSGWFLLHAFVRNQGWVTRLQVPALVLFPLAWTGFATPRVPWFGLRKAFLCAACVCCVAYATVVAGKNTSKPISLESIFRLERIGDYHSNSQQERKGVTAALHVLDTADLRGCRRLGLYLDSALFDYPLTWQAMARGFQVRHSVSPSDWPCLIFSDKGTPPGGRCTPLGDSGLYQCRSSATGTGRP
jgi:hypothetical protein